MAKPGTSTLTATSEFDVKFREKWKITSWLTRTDINAVFTKLYNFNVLTGEKVALPVAWKEKHRHVSEQLLILVNLMEQTRYAAVASELINTIALLAALFDCHIILRRIYTLWENTPITYIVEHLRHCSSQLRSFFFLPITKDNQGFIHGRVFDFIVTELRNAEFPINQSLKLINVLQTLGLDHDILTLDVVDTSDDPLRIDKKTYRLAKDEEMDDDGVGRYIVDMMYPNTIAIPNGAFLTSRETVKMTQYVERVKDNLNNAKFDSLLNDLYTAQFRSAIKDSTPKERYIAKTRGMQDQMMQLVLTEVRVNSKAKTERKSVDTLQLQRFLAFHRLLRSLQFVLSWEDGKSSKRESRSEIANLLLWSEDTVSYDLEEFMQSRGLTPDREAPEALHFNVYFQPSNLLFDVGIQPEDCVLTATDNPSDFHIAKAYQPPDTISRVADIQKLTIMAREPTNRKPTLYYYPPLLRWIGGHARNNMINIWFLYTHRPYRAEMTIDEFWERTKGRRSAKSTTSCDTCSSVLLTASNASCPTCSRVIIDPTPAF